MERSTKRGRTGEDFERASPFSINHPISPPRKKPRGSESENGQNETEQPELVEQPEQAEELPVPASKILPSPFQLTRIHSLPPETNADTVALEDLIGDPLISECWEFNYL